GDVDVVISSIHAPARLLINTVGNRNHWLGLRLLDGSARRDMLGARIEVIRPHAPTLWRRGRARGKHAAAHDPRVLRGLGAPTDPGVVVGLGDRTDPRTVRVHWPDGRVEEWAAVAIDRWTVLTQGRGASR